MTAGGWDPFIREADDGADDIGRRFPRLDVAALLDPNRPPRRWILRDLLPEGKSVAVVAPAGVGKSLLLLAVAVAVARGDRRFAALVIPRPRRVLYVDMENTEDDLAERLESLGITPETAHTIERLVILNLPDLAPLDTYGGAAELEQILDGYRIGAGDLVILDSFQRVVQGPENDSDTYRAFYRCAGVMLKRRGVTVVRTDNSGKDPDRGARGSSSKRDDVDIEYRLTRDAATGHLRVTVEKTRISGLHGTTFTRETDDDGRLTYSTPPDPRRDAIEAARAALDAAGVPVAAGLNRAWESVKAAGYRGTRAHVREAMKERREPVPTSDGTPPAADRADDERHTPAHPDDGTPDSLESLGKTRADDERHTPGTVSMAAVPCRPPYIGAARPHTGPDYCPSCGMTGKHLRGCKESA